MATHVNAVRRRLPSLHYSSSTASSSSLLRLRPHLPTAPFSTSPHQAESPATESEDDPSKSINPKLLSQIYNANRSIYKKSVSHLRKTYAAEIASQKARDAKLAAEAESKRRRAVLERRRLKAMKSAENAARQIRKAEIRKEEWERELEMTQRLREKKKELYGRARQRVVDQLEAECHLWLTTEEEVEKALGNPFAGQRLWVRPGSIIGAPCGTSTGFGDEDFWRYECHTWDARPIYKSPQELMLEELEEMAFQQANINPKYWTNERTLQEEKRAERARLRAIVREEGRRALLEKQREMMRDAYQTGTREERRSGKLPPSTMPAPKLDYLADYEAQEREGVEIMKRDARKFFIFESDLPNAAGVGSGDLAVESSDLDGNEDGETTTASAMTAAGASMGRPVGLRNPFFSDRPTAFPLKVGRDLPKDSRTEKEKKRDERQERMRAAAEEAALAAKTGTAYEIAMAAEEDLEDGSDPIDYNAAEENAEKELWEGQRDEWNAMDRKVFDMTPPYKRLTNDEIDWLLDQLKSKVKRMQDRIELDDKFRRDELKASGGVSIETIDDIDSYVMEDLGYDMEMLQAMVQELTPEQSLALEEIDFSGRKDITIEEMEAEVRKVEGLTDAQVKMLVEMEMSLLKNEALSKVTKMG